MNRGHKMPPTFKKKKKTFHFLQTETRLLNKVKVSPKNTENFWKIIDKTRLNSTHWVISWRVPIIETFLKMKTLFRNKRPLLSMPCTLFYNTLLCMLLYGSTELFYNIKISLSNIYFITVYDERVTSTLQKRVCMPLS